MTTDSGNNLSIKIDAPLKAICAYLLCMFFVFLLDLLSGYFFSTTEISFQYSSAHMLCAICVGIAYTSILRRRLSEELLKFPWLSYLSFVVGVFALDCIYIYSRSVIFKLNEDNSNQIISAGLTFLLLLLFGYFDSRKSDKKFDDSES